MMDSSLWGLTLRISQTNLVFSYKYIAVNATYTEKYLDIGPAKEINIFELVRHAQMIASLSRSGGMADLSADVQTEREDSFQFGDRIF